MTAERAKTLEALGILPESADSFAQKTEITRAEFAYIAARAAGCSDMSGGDDSAYFLDVADDSKYKNAIGSAVKLGLMRGTDEYTFEPDRAVAYTEAIKVTLCLLGYEWMAEASGGYPSGYIKAASMTKISLGIPSKTDVTRRDMFVMLYNAMLTNIMESDSYTADGNTYRVNKDETFLSINQGIYYNTGVLTAAEQMGIKNIIPTEDDEVIIDDKLKAAIDAYYEQYGVKE